MAVGVVDPAALPRWFSPTKLLFIFTLMSLIVYLDRGLIASTSVNGQQATQHKPGFGIQGDFNLSNFEDGCLPAAFMVGLLIASPIFAHFSTRVQPFKLAASGLLIWSLSVAACALTWNFWSLLVCRAMVGIGEASFVILAAPFIDKYAPPRHKSVFLAIFLMAIPVGYAFGYIYGGFVGAAVGWRLAFVSEACLMLPLTIFAFATQPVPLHDTPLDGACPSRAADSSAALPSTDSFEPSATDALLPGQDGALPDGSALNGRASTSQGFKLLFSSPTYVLAVLGNTMHTALLGMFAYWGPKAVTYMFHLGDGVADVLFGAVTVLTGVLGTLMGGLLSDHLGGTQAAASSVCLLAVAGGFVVMQLSFGLAHTLPTFVFMFALGELLLFMLQSPVTKIILLSVPTSAAPLAFSMQTVCIHVFGDVPSPPLAGWIHDHVFHPNDEKHPQSWRYTSMLSTSVLLAATCLFIACYFCSSGKDTQSDLGLPSGPLRPGTLRGSRFGRRRQRDWQRLRALVRVPETVEEGDTPASSPMCPSWRTASSSSLPKSLSSSTL